jgi:hypothetical protein
MQNLGVIEALAWAIELKEELLDMELLTALALTINSAGKQNEVFEVSRKIFDVARDDGVPPGIFAMAIIVTAAKTLRMIVDDPRTRENTKNVVPIRRNNNVQ